VEAHESDAGYEAERREAQLVAGLREVLWRSGLRSIEAILLRWEDVELEARTWRIRSPSNMGGDQLLPLHPDLVPVLRRRRLEISAEAGPFAIEWHVRKA
jgi:integrase